MRLLGLRARAAGSHDVARIYKEAFVMELTERAAYLKGLIEGLGIDETT